jgi:murein DD-endopeptidase MepM/ murein hydrolase activator NlpD
MAENRGTTRGVIRRCAGISVAVVLVAALGVVPHAGATDIKQRLDQAKGELARLQNEIQAERAHLDQLSAQAAALAVKLDAAQSRWEQITAELNQTRDRLDQARKHYLSLRNRLDERAREAYMQGPGNSVEFLLGATSLADLSDRIEFVNALTQTDADLANAVQNVKNELAAQARDEAKLQAEAAAAYRQVQKAEAVVEAKLAEQQQLVDDINHKIAQAKDLVAKLGKQYQHYLESLTGLQFHNGIFKVCPVDQPRAVSNDFGAPRYSGGYHPHAGNDIIAPMGTAIRAPFDGTARSSWNTLGGNSVYVYGAYGYVYNAHLSQYSSNSNGPVQAGEIIGYVGNTGDAQGGITHDHFEWHPNAIPSNWPQSPYGYSTLPTGAINPYPLLSGVC